MLNISMTHLFVRKNYGATIADTVTASADFARLGYTLDEAAQLADAALVYKNVGDGIEDVSQASESIISTMKAFGIEAENAISIVDKFNEVGNNFAISSEALAKRCGVQPLRLPPVTIP